MQSLPGVGRGVGAQKGPVWLTAVSCIASQGRIFIMIFILIISSKAIFFKKRAPGNPAESVLIINDVELLTFRRTGPPKEM